MSFYSIDIKPLSVNEAWKGRRFKTGVYKAYEQELMLKLPKIEVPEGNLHLSISAGFSSKASDIDNCLKPFIDILQKKYGFDDNRVYKLSVSKVIVKKGDEFIGFWFEPFTTTIGMVSPEEYWTGFAA